MKKWLKWGVLFGIVAYVSYGAYDTYRGGYFSIPDLPEGSYPISFENGLRAIVLDARVTDPSRGDDPKLFRRLHRANPDREYLGVPYDVQSWFEDAWSWCKSPTAKEQAELAKMPEDFRRTVENARFEAVCRIHVDGADIVRGLIFSVPKTLSPPSAGTPPLPRGKPNQKEMRQPGPAAEISREGDDDSLEYFGDSSEVLVNSRQKTDAKPVQQKR